ncbi:MAG: hypothetical protein WBD07_03250 [Vicinamibacterales bacterium]
MNHMLSTLVARLSETVLSQTNVIPWSSPVPAFGDPSTSTIATVGLNPSNREFVDGAGLELQGSARRFHTLNSLGLARWRDANATHLRLIVDSCRAYFFRNPYDGWFKKLDRLISGTRASYYDASTGACHLDLIPYATACKWTELTRHQRSALLDAAGDTLGLLLRDSAIRVLILNGSSVVEQFQIMAETRLDKRAMSAWSLPRRLEPDVKGVAYRGTVRELAGIALEREVLVLGFNHNIQSSFGVTTRVTTAIGRWITQSAAEALS